MSTHCKTSGSLIGSRLSLCGALAVLAGVALLLGGAVPGCKKGEDKSKDKDKAASKEKSEAREKPETREKARAGEDKTPKTRGVAPARVTIDADLQKKLAEVLGKPARYEKLIKRVKGAEGTFAGLGSQGKGVYAAYLAAAEALKKSAEQAEAKKFEEIPLHVVSGLAAGTVTIEMLAKHIAFASKKAAQAARSLKVGKAKKFGKRAKNLGRLTKVAKTVLKVNGLLLGAILKSKSESVRLAAFAAGVEAAKKADAVTKKVLVDVLKKLHTSVTAADAKAKMADQLKQLQ